MEQKKPTKIFNVISLVTVNEKAAKTAKRPKAAIKVAKVGKLKTNKVNSPDLYPDLSLLEYSPNSIRGFLGDCHPDVRKFIETNEWAKIVATPGKLTVTTRNRFTVVIESISRDVKSIVIRDHKKRVHFKDRQQMHHIKK
jgi:hypothetical protein